MVRLAFLACVCLASTACADPGLVGIAEAQPPRVVPPTPGPGPLEAAPRATPEIPPNPHGDVPGRVPALEQPEALTPFFEALARTGITRVTHLGDSSIGLDDFPHRLRQTYQGRHGDAGPGFLLLQPHSASYLNRTAWVRARPLWDLCFIIRRCARDGHYGLGGVTVSSRGGATSTIAPRGDRPVSRAELWYAAHPGGGRIVFRFGRGRSERIQTRAPALEDRWHQLRREPGDHAVQVLAGGGGLSRAYGVVLENEGPGVVWDTLSMIGAFTPRILAQDEDHFAAQLSHRDPDLVMLNYGGNDLRRIVGGAIEEEGLRDETEALITRVREAVPGAGCLLVGIIDHEMSGASTIEPEHVETVMRAQRAAAARTGCAYWDTVAAMGGAGSFGEWRRRGLASDDGKHLGPRGRAVIADRLVSALDQASGH